MDYKHFVKLVCVSSLTRLRVLYMNLEYIPSFNIEPSYELALLSSANKTFNTFEYFDKWIIKIM